jgi:hypothetical protein
MAVLDRFYKIKDMAMFPDSFEGWDVIHGFKYVGKPSWVYTEAIPAYPTSYLPTFTVYPPKGTSGTFTFTIDKYLLSTSTLVDTGTVTIDVQAWDIEPWVINTCNPVTLCWINPLGGIDSYVFTGKKTATQTKADTNTFINYLGQKRNSSVDEVYQGILVSSGNINAIHSRKIASLFKTIQAYLITPTEFLPILINPQTFRQVKQGEATETYEFEFMRAEVDVVATQ